MSELAAAAVLLMGVYGIRTHRDPFYVLSRAFLWLSIAAGELPGSVIKGWRHWRFRISVQWKANP
jgi:hypothetical protein